MPGVETVSAIGQKAHRGVDLCTPKRHEESPTAFCPVRFISIC